MGIDDLLSRLDGVRKSGPGRWTAKCPAHDDRSPSLGVRDGDDGRILVYCFAGCGIAAILGATGLTINDLFPARLAYNHAPMRRPFPAADVLETIAREAAIVATAACNIRQGIVLSDVDHERLLIAVERIHEARRLANGES